MAKRRLEAQRKGIEGRDRVMQGKGNVMIVSQWRSSAWRGVETQRQRNE